MKKKLFKIVGGLFLVFLALLVAIPFFLEGKIATIVKNKVNQNIKATLDFKEANLSLIKSFPKANVDLKDVVLVNQTPFEGDTLFAAKDIVLELSITELFKSAEEPIVIESLLLDGAKVHVQVDAQENASYDIAVSQEEVPSENEGESSGFSLNMQDYAITNATIIYDDFATGMHLALTQFNHNGAGDLSLQNSRLDTHTKALVSFEMDSTHYLKNNKIALDALIGVDLDQQIFTFLENKALVNQLPLVFDGFVKMNAHNQEVDISFKTPSSDFKNFLAVIPEAYASNLDGVETSGNFEMEGVFKGVVDEDHIPTFSINLNSENASFKYPNLPKAVRNVFIDAAIHNKTGVVEDTYATIDRLSFKIDEDRFRLNAKVLELLGNTKLNLHADGVINLANIAKAYPLPEDYGLKGILKANVSTSFDMASLEKHQYQHTKTNGKASLSGFHYESEELKHPVDIKEAAITFNPQTVSLDRFSGTTGQTDFFATGTLENLLGYMFNDEKLAGNFKLKSNTLSLDDFMVAEEEGAAQDTPEGAEEVLERIKIPSFLDAKIAATANTVLYDDLALNKVVGNLVIKDETATLNQLSSNIFGGKLMLNGKVSTKGKTSTFDMGLGIDGFKIAESFKAIGLFKALAPVAQALQGQLNSQIKLSGDLNPDMTPNLATLSGDLLGQLLAAKINTEKAPALAALDGQFGFVDFKALNLEDVKASLSFKEGKVATKPIDLAYKDISISISGEHTFDHKMEYKAVLEVPAKYLGKEVNSLIGKLNDPALANLTVPVTANIVGSYTSPKVATDLTSGVKNLTAQLVDIQKQKLLNQGKRKAKDLIGGLLGANKKDSADQKGADLSKTIGGLLGGKKDSNTSDSSKTNDKLKGAANSVLGGLFGKKKKKDTVN